MLNIMHLRIKDWRMPSRGMLQNPAYVIVIPGVVSHMKQTGMLVRNFEFNP